MTGEVPPSAGCEAAALAYLARGWSVLPLRPADKRPLVAWEPLQHERPDAETLRAWFARWPAANVGIVTGALSGLVVLDVDPHHGGADSLAALERAHGPLPATVEAETGGGGRHLYFRHPGGLVRNRAGLRQGIDLRGDGGYVVAPPSRHPSGGLYRWRPGGSPDALPPAHLPLWLLGQGGGRLGRSLADWRELVRAGVPEGQRNDSLASLAGHLLWHGVDPDVTLELLLAWNRQRCRPPLDDAEVAQVTRNIVRLHEREDGPPGSAAG
ncbi:Primase C terminal 1 (PriCT-1) [Tistlia consotensis]|uniref:Primase C terminal 1 (PriCT-1) n=1 Tax=Tistlia consotensis USBA 355 TaxID=560819 RepID=A0A1Y6B4Q2_9PROT|nr:bifunctional DNA primase/polymerase [Tistlia consotensis]SME90017.1 Primase C terminal 1 (PriCT-1) [Tistlia consotensis USBA 355]SNR26498.1 Primase C terminal 1 (PriCT-1) [Tistlia consotensis]